MSETIELIRGDDVTLRFELYDGNGDPIDATSIAAMTFTAQGMAGDITTDGTPDTTSDTLVVVVTLGHDLTATTGVYRADLQLTTSDGRIITPWLGTVHIIQDVTP